jgi:integrase
VNRKGKQDKHLLRRLQNIAKRAEAEFHIELHKLHKTGASRRYLAGLPLPTLMLELGHESLVVTQDYLADVRKLGEAKKPSPRLTLYKSQKSSRRARMGTDHFVLCQI